MYDKDKRIYLNSANPFIVTLGEIQGVIRQLTVKHVISKWSEACYMLLSVAVKPPVNTRSSAIAERPRDAPAPTPVQSDKDA